MANEKNESTFSGRQILHAAGTTDIKGIYRGRHEGKRTERAREAPRVGNPGGRSRARAGQGQQDKGAWSKWRPTNAQIRFPNPPRLRREFCHAENYGKAFAKLWNSAFSGPRLPLSNLMTVLFHNCGFLSFTSRLLLNSHPKSKSN